MSANKRERKRLERLKTKQTLVLSVFSSADYFTADKNHGNCCLTQTTFNNFYSTMVTRKSMIVSSRFFSLNSFFERKIPLRLRNCLYV